ncbi:2-dehydropantoate 2-reductase [Ferrimonas gelatinilytica]|uniref:2-dehydropantoate 2-reductase n=1 Tax=Ferrimonas gelatinilytica TaxID=1255257 RepID=A0ABP9S2U8_9GAMM
MARPVGILGAGAIGQLLGLQLAHQQVPISLLRRPGSPSEQRRHTLENRLGQNHHARLNHHASDRPQPLQALLVATKAHQVEAALAPVLTWLPPGTPILLLHNGMGPQQRLCHRYPEHQWWWGTLSDGALMLAPERVKHSGNGVRIAGPAPRSHLPPVSTLSHQQAPKVLRRLGFTLSPEIATSLWQKLTVNAVINPLASRDAVPNGALLQPKYRAEIALLCRELAQLGQALGHPEPEEKIRQRVLAVAEATAANRCSTLQDRDAVRPDELAQISGYLLAEAQRLNLEMPSHSALYYQLHPAHASLCSEADEPALP